jgi:hypothetical protein
MSHTMNIKMEIHDEAALKLACEALGYTVLGRGTYNLHETSETGIGIQMLGMKYPTVIKENGEIAYDWGGRITGSTANRLDKSIFAPLEAQYGMEKARIEAIELGYLTTDYVDPEADELVLKIQIPD